MEKTNKRKAELGKSVEGKVLFVAGAENADGILHDFIEVLEDHRYEVFKCIGVGEFVSEKKKNRCDIILTEGNLLGPMDVSQQPIRILLQTNYPVIMISSDGCNISSHYHWLKGDIVRPILELVELFCERITKSGEVKRQKDKIKQVELPDEEEQLEEVEHDELPDERNKKKIEREKAGEHHQRMVWTGEPEQMFVEIVTDLEKIGKVTGKEVWKRMQEKKSLKHISIKQVNSHLQKHRGKLKKVHPADNSSPGQDLSRHGMEEHSSKTDAPTITINGNLNTTSQEQHLITDLPNNDIPGNIENPSIFSDRENFGNGKGKDFIQDLDVLIEYGSWADLLEIVGSSPRPIEATPLYTREGQPSNLLVNNIPSQALDKNVFDLPSKEDEELLNSDFMNQKS